MQFYIDVTNSSGTRYGGGPITSASYWRSTQRVDRIGSFEFAMPASDEKAAEVVNRRYVTCYAILEHEGPTAIGSGIIDRVETRPGSDGDVELVVSGDDLIRELSWQTVGRTEIASSSSAVTHAVAVSTLDALTSTWTFNADPSPLNDEILYYFSGEKLWAAALKVAELSRCHVWMPSSRLLRFRSGWSDSGLRAIEAPANPGSPRNLCYISGLTRAVDSQDLVTRIYPVGPQIPSTTTPVDLSYYVGAVDTGYTIDQEPTLLQYYLERDDAIATYGAIEEWIAYNDIYMDNFTSGPPAAAQLYSLALWELQRRGQLVSYYSLELGYSPVVIQPMTTIRCVFRRAIDGRNVVTIDDTLYVMGATTTVDAEGLRTTALEVATQDRWPPSDLDIMRKLYLDNLRSNL